MKYAKLFGSLIGSALMVFAIVFFSARRADAPAPAVQESEILSKSSLKTQTNDAGGVSVSVTPRKPTADGAWEFEVSLSTHSIELGEDMTKVTILVLDGGKEFAPIVWEGSPPGGHHREGILKFAPPASLPKSVTLKMRGIGDVAERSFVWTLR